MTSEQPDGQVPDDPDRLDGAVEVALPAELSSAARARAVVHACRDDLDPGTLGDVELIVSELVANAVLHGRPDIVLRVRVEPFAVDVAVLDHGTGLPPSDPTFSGPSATSGRGLALVHGLAHDWGVQALDGDEGKIVWATVRR